MNEELANRLVELEHEREELNQIENFINANQGNNYKWFKSRINAMIRDVRGLYSHIRADNSTAVQELVTLQTEELTLKKVLDVFSNLEIRKKEVDKEIALVSNGEVEEVSEPVTRR